jgi:hypothetical protein
MLQSVAKNCDVAADEPALSFRASLNHLAQDANSSFQLVSVKKNFGCDNGRLSEVIRCPLYRWLRN